MVALDGILGACSWAKYFSAGQIKNEKDFGTYGQERCNIVLVGKPEGMKSFGRSRRKQEHNIKTDHQEFGWSGTDWIDLAEDRDKWRAF
jgi:hypothetical protein